MGFSNWFKTKWHRAFRRKLFLYRVSDGEIAYVGPDTHFYRNIFCQWLSLNCPHTVLLGYDRDQEPFFGIMEVSVWMHDNCGLRWVHFDPMCGAFYASFADPNDAFHFRLRFADARIEPPTRAAILHSYSVLLKDFEIVEKP